MRTTKQNQDIINALVQNSGFRKVKYEKLPTIDYVYPDYTQDGNREDFRFYSTLRQELAARKPVVRTSFENKYILCTTNESILLEAGKIAPRLGLEELISGKINSIYAYAPLLFVCLNDKEFVAYVVKPVIDASMAWFEFTQEENKHVEHLLESRAYEKPYRNFFQKLLGGLK